MNYFWQNPAAPGGHKLWLIDVYGCTDPRVLGPYKTWASLVRAARGVRKQQREDDSLFWAEIREGKLSVNPFVAGLFP